MEKKKKKKRKEREKYIQLFPFASQLLSLNDKHELCLCIKVRNSLRLKSSEDSLTITTFCGDGDNKWPDNT